MVQRLPSGYVFDPADPRAPSLEQWEQMAPDERARVIATLDEAGARQLDEVIARQEELASKLAEEQRLREEEQRRREYAEQKLAEALAEIERLRKGGGLTIADEGAPTSRPGSRLT